MSHITHSAVIDIIESIPPCGERNPIYTRLTIHPFSQFDEIQFYHLLEGSLALSIDDKRKIIIQVPFLSQEQIDGLFTIFEDERKQFREFSARTQKPLKQRARRDWKRLFVEFSNPNIPAFQRKQIDD